MWSIQIFIVSLYQVKPKIKIDMKKVVVSENLMHQITALCDVLISENNDAPLTSVAMSIRREIDKGLEYV